MKALDLFTEGEGGVLGRGKGERTIGQLLAYLTIRRLTQVRIRL